WLAGRAVVVRADLNVPLDDGVVSDDQRIRASLPTLRFLADSGARVALLSHLGRPKGKPDPALSLEPVAERLERLLEFPVRFCPSPNGPEIAAELAELPDGGVILL
ncbi:MAG: phosphoglycerate kinase, partial [Actinobacteria bacterium]|nr:phosphoglycerate kinase [Actinomycetota bacterium]NIS31138.1 phosphoglycerate kinase [Actinomycetota bacterium]NIU66286.1 phosphoglycerate kinase [Actinomycetota bacterium]NIW28100.1 phosphoglycerate kinase [Actinomycetota bacterium]NIX20588.1 phosphoglycerate kinase [Actinomycetota bacterium]